MSVYTVDVTTSGWTDLWKRKPIDEPTQSHKNQHQGNQESHENNDTEHQALTKQIEDLQAIMQESHENNDKQIEDLQTNMRLEHHKIYSAVTKCSQKINKQSDILSTMQIELSNLKHNKQPETPPARTQNREPEYTPAKTTYFDQPYLTWFRSYYGDIRQDLVNFENRIHSLRRGHDDEDRQKGVEFFEQHKHEFDNELDGLLWQIEQVRAHLK
jgi:hypothetical protein